MFLSIVIPAYNEERYLPRCLEALHAQNYRAKDFEIIVVDNASTDATADIARRFGAAIGSNNFMKKPKANWAGINIKGACGMASIGMPYW